MKKIDELLENNRRWAKQVTDENPRFFADLAGQQNPDYLWIGCSDSRVSANVIVDLAPGEVFVHRNVANLVNHTDMNCLSVIQFAVEVLQVEHIIVCGHYGCSGVSAALQKERVGLADNWLRHVQDVHSKHDASVAALPGTAQRVDRLCELNVIEQVANVCQTTIAHDAWDRGQSLAVHGWVYGLQDGLIRDLAMTVSHSGEMTAAYASALASLETSAGGPP